MHLSQVSKSARCKASENTSDPFITPLASDILLVLDIVNPHGILPRPQVANRICNVVFFQNWIPVRLHLTFLGSSGASPVQNAHQNLLLIAVHARATSNALRLLTSDLRNADSRLVAVWQSSSVFSRSVLEFRKGIRAAATFRFRPVRRVIMMLKVILVHPCGAWRSKIPSGKLTWQWKMDLLKMYSLLKMGISIAMLVYWRVDSIVKSNHSSPPTMATHWSTCVASIHGEISTWWSGKQGFFSAIFCFQRLSFGYTGRNEIFA